MPSHLGQELKDHVMLIARQHEGNDCGTLSFRDRAFFRVAPDGDVDPKPFKIPKGRLLVVTDVEWSAYGGPNGTNELKPNRTLSLSIHIGDKPQIEQNPVVFRSSLTLDQAAAEGRPGKSEYLTAGFLVAAATRLCPNVVQSEPSFGATAFVDTLILRGYLAEGR